MRALIIGGARHGEWAEGLPDGIQVWVDIANAARHRIRKANHGVTNAETGEVTEAYLLHLAVHEDLLGPREVQIVGDVLNSMAMNAFMRANAEPITPPKEPAITIPKDPT